MTCKAYMRSLDQIVKSGLCTGCGLCQALAPEGTVKMQMSEQGYLRPIQHAVIASDRLTTINQTCPGVTVEHPAGLTNYDSNWGPIETVNVGFAQDATIRRQGSSGGVVSALCVYLLETGQVDFIAQIAADDQNPVANKLQMSRTKQDIINAAGSRYAPTAPLANITELLKTQQRFAFVGKPCDIAALRAYLRLYPEFQQQIPYLISFMCAGIPSQHATTEVIKAMGADPDNVQSFRYRGDGWPGMARTISHAGAVHEMDYNSSWGNILGKQLQYRCKICADGIGEFADVVCADAWYGKDGYPDFTERDGRSLVIARTQKGSALVSQAVLDGAINIEPSNLDEVALMQPYQLNRKRLAAARGIATLLARGSTTRFKRLNLPKIALQTGILNTLRNAWGTFRRAKGE